MKQKLNIKRAVAMVLSVNIMVSGMTLSVSAENRIKALAKKHPIVTSVSSVLGAIPLICGAGIGIAKLAQRVGNARIHTPVDSVPEAEIQSYLNTQIDEFVRYGQDEGQNRFVVSDKIRQESDPRVLALVIKSINMIFEKDAFLLNALKAKLREGNHTLRVDWGEDDMYNKFFCTLSTLDYFGITYVIKINKIYGKSFGRAKSLAKNQQLPQRAIIWEIGQFFEECVFQKSHQLTMGRVFKLAQDQNPALNKDNKQFGDELFMRCHLIPFADLLADYVLETYPKNDIFMEIFEKHLNSLKELPE